MMRHSNQGIVDKYIRARAKRDMSGIREVLSKNITWHFHHDVSGVEKDTGEVVDFYDQIGEILTKPGTEPIVCENEHYMVQCFPSKTHHKHRHYACILWAIENGKITEGHHFFASQETVNRYFSV